MKLKTIILTFAAVLSAAVAATAAASASPRELVRSAFLTPTGHVAKLAAGVTYTASDFPIPLHVTSPDATWGGAQWKADSSWEHRKNTVAPFYGWVTFSQHAAHGVITMMTPYGSTPSMTAVVAGLRNRGHGATYTATSAVKLGGYAGIQFDGTIVGREHAFIPFSPKTTAARWYPDNYGMNKGEVFRIVVVNVRGKTVVVYIENAALPAAEFPAFLTRAAPLLKSLKLGP